LTAAWRGSSFNSVQDIGKLILRLTLSVLILFHGVDTIIHGTAWMQEPIAALHLPSWVGYGVYIGEVIAPLLLILGLGARAAAFVIAVTMIMAVILDAHRLAFTINADGGWGLEQAAFFFMSAIAVIMLGPGRFRLFGAGKAGGEPAAPSSTVQ
jgi:putative oxidoreductase